MSVQCPVCDAASILSCELTPEQIRRTLQHYFGQRLPDNVAVETYSMRRCNSCGLVFADPMKPGDSAFYAWITSQRDYYPKHRWEWDRAKTLIGAHETQSQPSVVDVGCGGGDFMAFLSNAAGVNIVGLDTTTSSVDACRRKGLTAHCADIDQFAAERPSEQFDYCVTFHCIEHVDDPLGFMRGIKRLLAKGGKIVVSAPYSPMSFEEMWFDPLNHPPHHLTR